MTQSRHGKIKTLFVAANPVTMERLKLDEEIRAIKGKIRASEHRDTLELIPVLAARYDDLLQSFNEHKAQIVHFSTHGDIGSEIILVDERGLHKAVSTKALTDLFKLFSSDICVVVLNACYSYEQAKAITHVIDCAIGIKNTISNDLSIIFSYSFYRAIGFGNSVQNAFYQGRNALLGEGVSENDMPVLLCKAGVDPAQIRIIPTDEDVARAEGRRFLIQGKNALSRQDYDSAIAALDKALVILSNEELPQELARAKYFQAIAKLKGRRPFILPKPIMDTIDNLLRSAIMLDRSYSYMIASALFKMDFARNGFSGLANEAVQLANTARLVAQGPEDTENLKILFSCQPDLARDFVNS